LVIVENPAGRLITFRVVPPVDHSNATHAATELRTAIAALGVPVVICADLTQARTFSADTSEQFVALMKSDNPKLERSALLLSDASATLLLQMARIVREAASPARRTFHDRQTLREWLHPVLSLEERGALEKFLEDAETRRGPSIRAP
jgi:hypothetical protein